VSEGCDVNDQDRELVDELAACGLAAAGDPAAVTVDASGSAVHVTVRRDNDRLLLEGRVQAPVPSDPGVLASVGLTAPGDGNLVRDGADLVARRTLVDPPRWMLFDAIHELAKQLVGLRRPSDTVQDEASERSPGSWLFVDTPTPLVANGDPSTPIAVLVPGTWYQVLAKDGAWVLVHHPAGADGWVPNDKVVFS